jgi:serine/threonine-protein kinase HipA
LDPVRLPLARGQFHTAGGEKLFPGLSDSAPDRWGRHLMARQARLEGRKDTLFEVDSLLMVDDAARMGAVRFKVTADGPFEAGRRPPIPPLVRLGDLLRASDAVQRGDDDVETLKLLLAPGSSLGGARPKASVVDQHGRLSIAKFPSTTDDWPVVAWEHVVSELARASGLSLPPSALVDVEGRSVLVTRRFDRQGGSRVPFLSALALVGASDGDPARSYLEIADALRQHGVNVEHNLTELWSRMVFNVLISNTDDHLRNHGVLREGGGWVLAPAYDLNPFPVDVRPRVHALALDEASHDASLDTLLRVATGFSVRGHDAKRVARRIATAVSRWRDVAASAGIDRSGIERMSSAFEHADLDAARRLR